MPGLVRSGLVDLVDVLAVLPGVGGQPFQPSSLDKVRQIRAAYPALPHLMVDGGIGPETARLAAEAGANVLVSGSYLFAAPPGGMTARLTALEQVLLDHGE